MSHPTLGRYSFVTADPYDWIAPAGNTDAAAKAWQALRDRMAGFRAESIPGLPPFQGGALGVFGYALARQFEQLPPPRPNEFQLPDFAVGLYDWVVAYDHQQQRGWLISTGLPETAAGPRRRRALQRMRRVREILQSAPHKGRHARPTTILPSPQGIPLPGRPGVFGNFSRDEYLAVVRRAVEYIHAGDCFQVNLAQRLFARFSACPAELFGRLRERNASPFGGYLDGGDWLILSASPERFLCVADGVVETRPIKGTRPRGTTPEHDALQRQLLQTSSKDRAENVMIVDLMRNDLGRVCAYGSVKVPSLCEIETYRFVHHLVSQVRGRLRPGYTGFDLLRAAFPGGSVTGAPKIRAMEIIEELEKSPRGFYCGSLGYIGFDGQMDTNILIRTFTLQGGWLQFSVGGGIVADSVPELEYEETLHKAEGLFRALAP
jgi:para-aminobenzoate synthetase component I